MNFPLLPLLRPKARQRPIPPLHPRNLNNNKPHKIRQRPVTTMRTEHIQILNIQRPPAPRKEIIDLSVVIEKEHALLGDFLAGEVMCFKFDVGGEFCDGSRASWGCGCCWGQRGGGGPAEDAAEGLPEGGGGVGDGGDFEGVGEILVDGGVDAVCDCYSVLVYVPSKVKGRTAYGQ